MPKNYIKVGKIGCEWMIGGLSIEKRKDKPT